MKIEHNKMSQYGPFSITPDEGWQVGPVFVDFSTKLLIVHESSFQPADGSKPSAWARRVTTVNFDTDEPCIIPVDERPSRIDYSERSEIDESLGLRSVVRREINPDTGDETIIDELFTTDTGARRASATRPAFSKDEVPTYLETARRRQRERQRERDRARDENASSSETARAKAFAARVAYWSGQIHRHMRNQSENGLDEYGGFTPEWYEHGKSVDRNFDAILRALVQRDKGEFNYQGYDVAEFLRRIGKPELANPSANNDEPGLLDKLRGLLSD